MAESASDRAEQQSQLASATSRRSPHVQPIGADSQEGLRQSTASGSSPGQSGRSPPHQPCDAMPAQSPAASTGGFSPAKSSMARSSSATATRSPAPVSPVSAGSSAASEIVAPVVVPPHLYGTRLQKGIRQPRILTDGTVRYGMLTSTGEPKN